jgi:hypothetical protein
MLVNIIRLKIYKENAKKCFGAMVKSIKKVNIILKIVYSIP